MGAGTLACGRHGADAKRLKLTGAPKYGRMSFVRQPNSGNQVNVRSARGLSARSLSAIR